MGENKHIKELDAFSKKYLKDLSLKKTSTNFTSVVMQAIAKEKIAKKLQFKALISKKTWFIIIALVLAIVIISFKTKQNSLLSLPKIDFSFLEKMKFFNVIDSITISNTVVYAVFFFALMILAQVVYLKKYFNKRYQ